MSALPPSTEEVGLGSTPQHPLCFPALTQSVEMQREVQGKAQTSQLSWLSGLSILLPSLTFFSMEAFKNINSFEKEFMKEASERASLNPQESLRSPTRWSLPHQARDQSFCVILPSLAMRNSPLPP